MELNKVIVNNKKIVIENLYLIIKISLLTGIVLAFANSYLALLFSEMSIFTHLGFLILFMASCFVLAIFVKIIISIFLKNVETRRGLYYSFYFICLYFLNSFVYVNLKLSGGWYFSNFRAIVLNLSLFLSVMFLGILIVKVDKVKKQFLNIWKLLQIVLMVFSFNTFFNYFFMNWSIPPQSKIKVLVFLFSFISIPFLVIIFKILFDRIFSILVKSQLSYKLLEGGIVITIILLIPLLIKNFDNSSFYSKENQNVKREHNMLEKKPNIVLIVLDTARRDHLSCYGYYRTTTSNIDKFSKDGIIFTNCVSAAPWTLPSHASLFTGMYSSKHGAHHSRESDVSNGLNKDQITLAEILKHNGYNTAGIVSNFGVLNKNNNFNQGFSFYFDGYSFFYNSFWGLICKTTSFFEFLSNNKFFKVNKFSLSSEINELVFRWLKEQNAQPFFLFINYMEPHSGIRHLPGYYNSLYDFNWRKWPNIDKMPIYKKEKTINKQKQQILYDWYDCKLTYLDSQLGKLFEKLKNLDIYNNSLIIIISDHGELFYEHYAYGHETELYNELIMIPLIVKYPDNKKLNDFIDRYVQTVDIMPEILSNLNIAIPEDVQGQPLNKVNHKIISELFRKKDAWERWDRDLKAIYSQEGENYKYIQSTDRRSELFDLSEDFSELDNIISVLPTVAKKFDGELSVWRKSFKSHTKQDKRNRKIEKDLKDRLKSLGYIK